MQHHTIPHIDIAAFSIVEEINLKIQGVPKKRPIFQMTAIHDRKQVAT